MFTTGGFTRRFFRGTKVSLTIYIVEVHHQGGFFGLGGSLPGWWTSGSCEESGMCPWHCQLGDYGFPYPQGSVGTRTNEFGWVSACMVSRVVFWVLKIASDFEGFSGYWGGKSKRQILTFSDDIEKWRRGNSHLSIQESLEWWWFKPFW